MTTSPASMGGPLSEADDMRREIVLREINQGALAGMDSEISGQAADLVLAALDRYDAWKVEQGGGDLAEVKAALRPGFAITLSQLVAESQRDTHPLADAAGSTGPYVVQGCVVYGAQQIRDALRKVWRHTPALLDELEAARARVGVLEGQLATAQGRLRELSSKQDRIPDTDNGDWGIGWDDGYNAALAEVRHLAAEVLPETIAERHCPQEFPGGLVICVECSGRPVPWDFDDDSLVPWPCPDAQALGLDGGGSDAE